MESPSFTQPFWGLTLNLVVLHNLYFSKIHVLFVKSAALSDAEPGGFQAWCAVVLLEQAVPFMACPGGVSA